MLTSNVPGPARNGRPRVQINQGPMRFTPHATIAPGDTEIPASHTQSIGDVRVVGRYLGLTADHSIGVQLGFKLPTGSFNNNFIAGPQEGEPLDRGLQPGTGTTDLIVGAFNLGALSRDWDYFAQGMDRLHVRRP